MAKRLYLSFAADDEGFARELSKHIAPLTWDGDVEIQSDQSLGIGVLNRDSRLAAAEAADIIVFLVSAEFFNDAEIRQHVLKRALERNAQDGVPLIPIRVRDIDLGRTPLNGRTLLPRDGKPVNSPKNDTAWTKIAIELRGILGNLPEKRSRPAPPPGAGGSGTAPDPTAALIAAIPDHVPLTGAQIGRLRDALASAFPTWPALAAMVRIELDIKLSDVGHPGPMPEVAMQLITHYETSSHEGELIRAALKAQPNNRHLLDLAREIARKT